MKWYEANTIDELKSIGKLTDVKREINKDIKKVTGLKAGRANIIKFKT